MYDEIINVILNFATSKSFINRLFQYKIDNDDKKNQWFDKFNLYFWSGKNLFIIFKYCRNIY